MDDTLDQILRTSSEVILSLRRRDGAEPREYQVSDILSHDWTAQIKRRGIRARLCQASSQFAVPYEGSKEDEREARKVGRIVELR
jgi:hypothetical protein